MWWDYQNLNATHTDKRGTRWNFRVWHEIVDGRHVARVFFWDDVQHSTGVVLLSGSARSDVRYLHTLIQKLVADAHLRAKHQREVRFPLERHYEQYGAFPEETSD
jgi:hypothetical protein